MGIPLLTMPAPVLKKKKKKKKKIKYLLENGTNTNINGYHYGTLLNVLCKNKNMPLIKYLLKKCANINTRNRNLNIPLLYLYVKKVRMKLSNI